MTTSLLITLFGFGLVVVSILHQGYQIYPLELNIATFAIGTFSYLYAVRFLKEDYASETTKERKGDYENTHDEKRKI